MESRGLNPDDFQSYFIAFRYGLPPDGGFGKGVDRLVAQLGGFSNIREAALFPRDLRRLEP